MATDSPEFAGNLARCRVRLGQRDEKTRELLQHVALKDTPPEWVEWARMELIKMRSMPVAPTAEAPRQPTTRPAGDSGT